MGFSVRCSYVCPIIIGIIFILIGFIMTMVGNFRKPFFSASSSSWCDFCREDTDNINKTNKNLRVAGPIMLGIGFLILIVSIIRCRSNYQKDLAQNQNAKFVQPTTTTTTRLTTYNNTGPTQQGPSQVPYNNPQNQQYPAPTYPTGPANYQSTPSYPQPPQQPYPNTGGYGPTQPVHSPYPPMATAAPTSPYPPPQESYPTKGEPPLAPPTYADAVNAEPSAPPSTSQY